MATEGEKMKAVMHFLFSGSKITADGDCSHEIRRHLLLGRRAMTNQDSVLKTRHHPANSGPNSQVHGLPSVHRQLWQLDHEEGRAAKNRRWEDPWKPRGQQGGQAGNSTLNISWKDGCWSWNSRILVIWCKQLTHWKSPWYWERLGQKAKRASADKMAGWRHQCNGHELGQTSRDDKGEARHATVHGAAKSWTWLGYRTTTKLKLLQGPQHFLFYFHLVNSLLSLLA